MESRGSGDEESKEIGEVVEIVELALGERESAGKGGKW